MSLVELARFGTKVEADLARLQLAHEGIESFIFDSAMNNMFGGGGLISVRLMVDEAEADEAAAILSDA